MSGGLRFESLADMPTGMRKLVADHLILGRTDKAIDLVSGEITDAATAGKTPKTNKYHNIETEHNGIRFDSQKEADRYDYLCFCQEQGWIEKLRLQVEFTLQPAYTTVSGERVRAIRYMADFTYKIGQYPADPLLATEEDREYWGRHGPGAEVVEDVKSRPTRTKTYIIKKKMLEDRLGITIRET